MTADGQPHADADSRPDAGDQAEAAGVGGTVDRLHTGPDSRTATRTGGSHHRGVELHQRNQTVEQSNTADSDVPLRLTALIRLAEGRPPKISAVVRKLHKWEDNGDRTWFEDLLQQTVPDHAWEILQLDSEWDQVVGFAARFSMDHFPLWDQYLQMNQEWAQEEPEDSYLESNPYTLLKQGIPFQLMGFTWEDQHEMWDQVRDGLSALALLAETPDYDHLNAWGLGGMRVAWLEAASGSIPEETLRRIPDGGIPLEMLEQAVRGTPLDAAPLAAMWVHGVTGTFFLDEYFPDDNSCGYSDPWEHEIIEIASQEWARAKPILDGIDRLATWLEEDLPARFRQMLNFIIERLETIPEYRGAKNGGKR